MITILGMSVDKPQRNIKLHKYYNSHASGYNMTIIILKVV